MEDWGGEKFCPYCARSKVTSNKGTPRLTEQSSAAMTQPDTETTLVWHVGCGKHPLPTPRGRSWGTGGHSLSSHVWDAAAGTGVVPASDPLSVASVGMCAGSPGPYASPRFTSFFRPLQDFLWAPSPRTDYRCFAKNTLSVFDQLTPKEPQGHSSSQTLTAPARGKKAITQVMSMVEYLSWIFKEL